MFRVGGPLGHARGHGYYSSPGQDARNNGTGVDTTVSPQQLETGMW